jgi:hypothetical protein
MPTPMPMPMPMRSLIASAIAAALAAAALPATAVDFSSITDSVAVTSDTGAYDLWASTCPNVEGGGTCGTATGAVAPTDLNNTLFFWGNKGDANNTVINLTYKGDQNIEKIVGVRIRTDPNGGWADTPLGPVAGPRPVEVPLNPGSDMTFDTSSRGADGVGNFAQGRGVFVAYGRETYDSTDYNSVVPFVDFLAEINTPSAAAPFTGLISDFPVDMFEDSNNDGVFIARQVPIANNLADGRTLTPSLPFSLEKDQTISIELYNEDFEGAVVGTVPVGYMDDILIDFLALPQLSVTPTDDPTDDPIDLGHVRAGTTKNDAGSITATNITTGTTANPELNGTFQALTGTGTSQIEAVDTGGSPNFALDFNASQTRDYNLDAAGVALALADADTGGKALSATQQITVDADDAGGPQTRELTATVVGPILGVKEQGGSSDALDYGSTIRFSVDLADADAQTKYLDISNLFSNATIPSALTNLTLDNVRIEGDGFSIANPDDFPADSVIAADKTFGSDLKVVFNPEYLSPDESLQPEDYSAQLWFTTDMNRGLDNTEETIFFNLLGTAQNTGTPSLAVSPGFDVDKQVRAGDVLGVITATNDGTKDTTLNNVVFADPTGTNADRLDWTDSKPGMDSDPGVSLNLPRSGSGDEATRTYRAALGFADTDPVTVNATQTVSATAADSPQDRSITVTTLGEIVGPVLGVNDGAETLDYGDPINLGELDIGVSESQELSIGNIFGEAGTNPNDTNLTIANVGLDDDFGGRLSILGLNILGECSDENPNPYDNPGNDPAKRTVVQATGGFNAAGICIDFEPGSRPGPGVGQQTGPNKWTFNTVLRFFTDMNRPFGDVGAGPFTTGSLYGVAASGSDLNFFGISVTATYAPSGVPAPGALALVGLGLAGLAGVRARRRWVAGRVGGGV